MSKAEAVWAGFLGLAGAGLAVTVTGVVVAAGIVDADGTSFAAIAGACQMWAVGHATPASVLTVVVGSLGLAVLLRTAQAMHRQLGASRRLERELRPARRAAGDEGVRLIDDAAPNAFCVGLLHPRIYVSTAAWRALGEAERHAVLAHERHHARRRDPLRLLLARSLAHGLFFLPIVRRLARRYAALSELAADAAAVRATGGTGALASALLKLDRHASPAVVGIAPERVDQLLGKRPATDLPMLTLLGGLATLGLAIELITRLAEAGTRASVALPALLADTCMLAMTLVPIAAASGMLLYARRLLAPRVY